MANPNAPKAGNDTSGIPLSYMIHDNAGADEAVLVRGLDAAVVDDETTKSGKMAVALQPTPTQGGLSVTNVIAAASTNATSAKASAGQVYGWHFVNQSADTWAFVKLYNKASAPTVGTDTPVLTIGLPPGGGTNVEFTNGIAFGTGIALAVTGDEPNADTTAVAAGQVVGGLMWK